MIGIILFAVTFLAVVLASQLREPILPLTPKAVVAVAVWFAVIFALMLLGW